jgi:hypothetical protein
MDRPGRAIALFIVLMPTVRSSRTMTSIGRTMTSIGWTMTALSGHDGVRGDVRLVRGYFAGTTSIRRLFADNSR